MWFIAAAAVIAAAVVWASFARTLADATPVPVADVPQTDAVVWRRSVYQSREALTRDLNRVGKTYLVWAKNHPAAASFLVSLERARRTAKTP